jgi:hypothetical protein
MKLRQLQRQAKSQLLLIQEKQLQVMTPLQRIQTKKEDDDEEREKKPKYDKKEKKEYDIETLGWGTSDQEIYNDYGVILNYVDNFMEEVLENDILSLFYLFDSAKL